MVLTYGIRITPEFWLENTGGPPLVRSPLVRIPLVQIFKVISKIHTIGISRIGYEVKFVLVEIDYVVPTSKNFV